MANDPNPIKLIIATLCLAFCGCAPKAIVVTPIAPVAAKAHTLAVKASAAARELRESATITEKASVTLGFQVSKALAEADRQRQAADVTPEEREMNFQTLTRIAAAAVEIERSAKHDSFLAAAHEADTVELADVAGDVAEAAVKSDKAVVALKTDNDKLGKDAAIGRGVKAVMWGVAIILALVAFLVFSKSGAKVAARLYSPFK